MGGHHYGLFFRNGWFSRNILRTVALFIGADAYVKYEYGIDVNYDFNTNAWSWWMDKTPEERSLNAAITESRPAASGMWLEESGRLFMDNLGEAVNVSPPSPVLQGMPLMQ